MTFSTLRTSSSLTVNSTVDSQRILVVNVLAPSVRILSMTLRWSDIFWNAASVPFDPMPTTQGELE